MGLVFGDRCGCKLDDFSRGGEGEGEKWKEGFARRRGENVVILFGFAVSAR